MKSIYNDLLTSNQVSTDTILPGAFTPDIAPKTVLQLDANRALLGAGSQEIDFSLMPEIYDDIILPNVSLNQRNSGAIDNSGTRLPDSSVDWLIGQTLVEVHQDLSNFATDPDFLTKMSLAFDKNWNPTDVKALIEGLLQDNFSAIPSLKIVSSSEIGGANGAFASTTNSVYLSKELLAQHGNDPTAIADVLLEEIGHFLDTRLNVTDTRGDEGEIFAAVVRGKPLSQDKLRALKTEDDTATVILDSKIITIEQDNNLSTARNIGTLNGTQSFTDFVGNSDSKDYYRFNLSSPTNFNLILNGLTANADVWLLDGNGNGIVGSQNSGTTAESINRTLNPGTYYVQVFRQLLANTNYNLRFISTPIGDGDDTLNTAKTFNVWLGNNTSQSTNASSSIGGIDLNDYYRFSLKNTSQVNLSLNGLQADANLQLLDRNGSVIQSSKNSGTQPESILRSLNPGDYFIRVYPSGNAMTNYTMNLGMNTVLAQVPANNWKAEYFNNINLAGTPVFLENLGDGSQGFSRNWGNGAPNNTPSDNFSARITTQRYLEPGLYQIKTQADDGMRVRIDNQTVIDKWTAQPFATNSAYFRSNGGTVPISIDYYEGGGAAAINFNMTPATKFRDPVNVTQQWKATVFSGNPGPNAPPTNFWEGDINNPNAIGEINLGSNTRSDGKKGINVDWGNGAPNQDNNRLPQDFFAMRAYTQADFDGTPYKFRARGDDGFQILAKNQATGQWFNITPANQWMQAYGNYYETTYALPAGRYDLHFHQYEGGGRAYLDLAWEKAGNPDIDIQLSYPKVGFTQEQIDKIEQAAQNWERIITKDKDSSGVLKIAVVQSPTDNPNWFADAGTDKANNYRNNFSGPDIDINGFDYHNSIRFNPNRFSEVIKNSWLVRLVMHEIGHTLGLDHISGDNLMDHSTFQPKMTNSIYNNLTAQGYEIDKNAEIKWN